MGTDVNAEYWKEYYKDRTRGDTSQFAKWVRPRITGRRTFDVGCGDGADTLFLAETEFVRGFDPAGPEGPMITQDYHTAMWEEGYRPGRDDTLYARWLFHSVPGSVMHQILEDWPGELFAETRVLPGSVDDSHWREPVDEGEHRALLIRLGYSIRYWEVSDKFSPMPLHRDERQRNPLLLRVWAYRI